MWYSFWADVIVALHVAYVSFVIVGQLLIVVGVLRKWNWVRNLWFRSAHLFAIAVVAAEALLGITCPLTTWEDNLRQLAGQEVAAGTFLGRCLDRLLFYDLPAWALNSLHIGFALLVLATFVLAPPRWRRSASVAAPPQP